MEPRWTNLIFSICLLVLIYCLPLTESYYTRADLFIQPVTRFPRKSATNKTTFNDAEKKQILDLHNAYRSIVMPSATDMPELMWDDDLEEYAINHTQACTGAHSHRTIIKKWGTNPRTWQTWSNMAENLYYSWAPTYSIEEAMYLYWEEGSGYDIETHNCTHQQTCGHYRALVESRSSRVGCAINICDKFSVSKYPTPAVFFQCIYDGAYLTARRPYTVGAVCSDCTREKLGYSFQHCRHRLCISPSLVSDNSSFNGDTSIVGLDYRDVPFITTPSPTTTTEKDTTTTSTDQGTSTTTITPVTSDKVTDRTTLEGSTAITVDITTREKTISRASSLSFSLMLCLVLLFLSMSACSNY